MRLYYGHTLNPRKACAAARYLQSPVRFVHVDLTKGEQRSPAFAALNPNLKVPVLDTGNGTIWESNAIICHLSRAAGADLWPDDERQIDIIRWLTWNSEHFTRHAGNLYFQFVVRAQFGLGEPDQGEVEEASGYVRKYGTVLNDHLDGRSFLVGDRLSVADFAVAITLPYAEAAHLPLDGFKAIARWHDRLNELEAWREPFPRVAEAA